MTVLIGDDPAQGRIMETSLCGAEDSGLLFSLGQSPSWAVLVRVR